MIGGYVARQRLVIQKNPDDVIAHYDLGLALMSQQQVEGGADMREVLQELRKAEKLMPNSPGIHSDIGQVLEQGGQDSDPLAEYNLAGALDLNATFYSDRLKQKIKAAAKKWLLRNPSRHLDDGAEEEANRPINEAEGPSWFPIIGPEGLALTKSRAKKSHGLKFTANRMESPFGTQ